MWTGLERPHRGYCCWVCVEPAPPPSLSYLSAASQKRSTGLTCDTVPSARAVNTLVIWQHDRQGEQVGSLFNPILYESRGLLICSVLLCKCIFTSVTPSHHKLTLCSQTLCWVILKIPHFTEILNMSGCRLWKCIFKDNYADNFSSKNGKYLVVSVSLLCLIWLMSSSFGLLVA